MKILCTLITVLLISIPVIAQNKISGNVSDAFGKPIQVTAHIPQLEIGTITDFVGYFEFTNIQNGSYEIIFSSLGYETILIKLIIKDEDIVKNIIINESVVEMEEIIISTPFHRLQSENVMKVERISINDLKNSGAMNLSNGISSISGVNVINTGIGIGKPVIRGLSSNRVLTYTQGVRLENQQFGDEHGLGINGSGIESVEIIKGPASLLYGSDALGGVLYFNPERFASVGTIDADINSNYYSNNNGIGTDLGVKISGDKLKFLIRGSYATFSDYKTGSDVRVTNSRNNEYDIKTGVRYQNSKIKTTLRYNYNRSNLGLPEEIGVQSNSKKLILPFQEIDNHIFSIDNNLFFSKSNLQIKLGYLHNDRREFEEEEEDRDYRTVLDDDAALRMKLNTFNYDIKYNMPKLGFFESIVGIQGMIQKNKNFGEELLIPDANKFDIGVFATTHFHKKKFGLQGGLRYDFRKIDSDAARDSEDPDFIESFKRNFNSVNAALGVKFDPLKKVTIRLNLSSGFRAPNLSELASRGVHEGTNRYEIGNSDLKNEQNFQTDLSVEYNDDHMNISLNGFYNTVNDFIYLNPTGDFIEETPAYSYLQSDANLYGGEIGLHIHPHPLDWLHIESNYEMVIGSLDDGSYLPFIPANHLTNTLRFIIADGKRIKEPFAYITYKNTFIQDKTNEFETNTEGYDLLSLGMGMTINLKMISLQIKGNITNITNEDYISHLSRLKSEGIGNIGRNYHLGLKLVF